MNADMIKINARSADLLCACARDELDRAHKGGDPAELRAALRYLETAVERCRTALTQEPVA